MSNLNELKDTLNIEESDNAKLSPMLNVLSILTYIGCAFAFLGSIYNYFTICKSAEKLSGSTMPDMGNGMLAKMMDGGIELINKQCDNRLLILLATLLCTALCFWGAMQMRNLKKQGLIIYSVGELLLPLITVALLGGSSLGGMLMLTGLVVPIVFVILYATQRKHLVN